MNLLHICHDYFPALYGLLLDKLDHEGHVNTMLVPTLINDKRNGFADNIKVLPCSKPKRFGYWKNRKRIAEYITEKVDLSSFRLIHAHFLFDDGGVSYLLSKKLNIPYIVTFRNSDKTLFDRKFYYLEGIRLLLNATQIVFLSPAYKRYVTGHVFLRSLREKIEAKSVVIPNGIDDFWHKNRYPRGGKVNPKKLTIITVAAINKNKNQLAVIKALKLLKEETGAEITYITVGRIKDRKIYRQLIEVPFVKHIDHQTKEELIMLYRNADIFIMSSFTESFGLVYAEAMTQGLPVIYSQGQGFDGQFNEGVAGFHVDPYKPATIKEAIIAVCKDYDSLSADCVSLSTRFDWKIIAKQYTDVFHKISRN